MKIEKQIELESTTVHKFYFIPIDMKQLECVFDEIFSFCLEPTLCHRCTVAGMHVAALAQPFTVQVCTLCFWQRILLTGGPGRFARFTLCPSFAMAWRCRFAARVLYGTVSSNAPPPLLSRHSRYLATPASRAKLAIEGAPEAVNMPQANNSSKRAGRGVTAPRTGRAASGVQRRRRPASKQKEVEALSITLPHCGLTARELAVLCATPVGRVLDAAREIDSSATGDSDTQLSPAHVELLADALGAPLVISHQVGNNLRPKKAPTKEDLARMPLRVPVVTIMGHVDVGKTTLLDALRKSNIAEHEKGGITQSIGAFRVSLPSVYGSSGSTPTVTFIDTPGHEAFTSMRAHGAGATDVVILVVAADDGVMPQTVEAAEHARQAGVPIVVAVNKCDKEGADADRARYQLLEMTGVNTEQLGGNVQCIEISAKTGLNLNTLVEAVLLQAELLDLRADPTAPAEAICLESRVHRQLGQLATVVVKWGRLRGGDHFVYSSLAAVSGDVYGRVRSMHDSNGKVVKEAKPGDAVAISGLKGSIQPGSLVFGVANEKEAKAASQDIIGRNAQAEATLDLVKDLQRRAVDAELKAARSRETKGTGQEASSSAGRVPASASREGDSGPHGHGEGGAQQDPACPPGNGQLPIPTVNVVVKADVQGVADAVAQCLQRLSSAECPVRILSVGVGDVTDNDVILASATGKVKGNIDEAMIVAFNVRTSQGTKSLASRSSVDVLCHSLIYKLEEEVIARNKEMVRSREKREHIAGAAGVLRVFENGAIAGCRVQDGSIHLEKLARVLRYPPGGSDTIREVVHEGPISSIKQFAKDVKVVSKGSECGVGLEGWGGFLPGDVIECVVVEEPVAQRRTKKSQR